MKFSHLFSGKPYDEIEKKADAFFQAGEYGFAKLEYERALHKSKKKAPEAQDRLKSKIVTCKNALALEHLKEATDLLEADLHEEAEDLLQLASELAQDDQLAVQIKALLKQSKSHASFESTPSWVSMEVLEDSGEFSDEASEWEYFAALINTLSESEQEIYLAYEDPFRDGYVKLNQGRFEEAVTLLSRALENNASSTGFIRLELASAHLNLGHNAEASLLLEDFLKDHPESLRAYPPLCEIYWQTKAFDRAQQLLMHCPKALRDSPTIQLLMGETLFHAGRYSDAKSHYLDYLSTHGADEDITLALAKTFEALGSKKEARQRYLEIMNDCRGCGKTVDPEIKQKYADISLETGDHSVNTLELYLGLAQEVPEKRGEYYQKISMIYELNGNENEALRFKTFAQQCLNEK